MVRFPTKALGGRMDAVGNNAKHPGKVTYVDGNTGQVLSEKDVSTVPEALRFADTPQGKVPVVKVVATTAGAQRTIREYGPDGQLLRSTVQVKSS